MKQQYAQEPAEVEVHRVGTSTDIILRKDITAVEVTGEDGSYTAYECDEVQHRYPGIVTLDEVEADFDTWWAYEGTEAEDTDETTEEDCLAAIENQITDIQLAICEVYELLA